MLQQLNQERTKRTCTEVMLAGLSAKNIAEGNVPRSWGQALFVCCAQSWSSKSSRIRSNVSSTCSPNCGVPTNLRPAHTAMGFETVTHLDLCELEIAIGIRHSCLLRS